ncbi:MAG TPA: hypothetical protein VKY65_08385 [Alphaproteobacteria bacterium]|nr:hypothetical protein [Alphaproteobacteria bacterium]
MANQNFASLANEAAVSIYSRSTHSHVMRKLVPRIHDFISVKDAGGRAKPGHDGSGLVVNMNGPGIGGGEA